VTRVGELGNVADNPNHVSRKEADLTRFPIHLLQVSAIISSISGGDDGGRELRWKENRERYLGEEKVAGDGGCVFSAGHEDVDVSRGNRL
jgi:hypothetical protein